MPLTSLQPAVVSASNEFVDSDFNDEFSASTYSGSHHMETVDDDDAEV